MAKEPRSKSVSGFDDPTPEAPGVRARRNHLLVVGIDQYQHQPRLHNCVKDCRKLIDILTQRYDFDPTRVTTLYNGEATLKSIMQRFRGYAAALGDDHNLVIYFSGHGWYDKVLKEGYWIPVEAGVEAIEDYIPNSTIVNFLRVTNTHHTFLMADSCFSGTLFAQYRPAAAAVHRLEQDPSRWGLTAGRNEIVSDGQDSSPFAENLLYLLENNQDDSVPVAGLRQRVVEAVASNSEQTPRGEPLQNVGHRGGQFVFHRKGYVPTIEPREPDARQDRKEPGKSAVERPAQPSAEPPYQEANHFRSLSDLQAAAKEKMLSDLGKGMEWIKEKVRTDSRFFNDLILQMGRFRGVADRYKMGLLRSEQYELTANQIRYALLSMIDDLEADDLRPGVIG